MEIIEAIAKKYEKLSPILRLFNFFWLTEIVLKLGSKTDYNKSNQTYI